MLLTDERVQSVSFVGSTPIANTSMPPPRPTASACQALGGAKNHMVVMPDADPQRVVSSLMGAAYGSAGERCMAISVAVCVGDEVADKLVEMLKGEISQMRTGPGLGVEPEPHMGPLVTREHQQKVSGYIDLGVEDGATLVCDGRGIKVEGYEERLLCRPDAVRPGHAEHAHLPRGLRPGAGRGAGCVVRRGAAADQRPRVRQRHFDLHP